MQKDTHQTEYVASSVEKKRVVVMYLFFGIFVSLNMKTLSEFESSHLRQAVGWRIVFIMALIL